MNNAKALYSPSVPVAGQTLDFSTAPGGEPHRPQDQTNAVSEDHFTQPATITDLFPIDEQSPNRRQFRNPFLQQPDSFVADILKDYNNEPDHSIYNDDDTLNYIDDLNQSFDDRNDLMIDNTDNNFTEQMHCLNRMRRFFHAFTTK